MQASAPQSPVPVLRSASKVSKSIKAGKTCVKCQKFTDYFP